MRPPPPLRPPTRRGRRRLVAALAGLLLVAPAMVGCSSEDDPESALDTFLAGWPTGKLDRLGFIDPVGARIAAKDVAEEIRQLSGDLVGTPPKLRRNGAVKVIKNTATGTATVDWTLPGNVHWTYRTTIGLARGKDDAWQVVWEPKVVQEKLTRGDRLSLRRLPATRAAILDGAGKPLVSARPVVVVGVQPSEVTDVDGLVRTLDGAFRSIRPALDPPIDLRDLPARLKAADPGAFVDVVTLRDPAYQQIKSRIHELPGTKFRLEQRDLAPTREFARALLGSVDPVQRDDIDSDPGHYAVGDVVGHGGLAGQYDERLRGSPGISVVVARKNPDGEVADTDMETFHRDPQPGTPVKVGVDVPTQNAADAALAGDRRRTALVALRISDGTVLAAANGPGAAAENLAFTAQVPPGSTFKMVSALSLLDSGAVGPETPVGCPRTFTVDGRSFKNSENFELGTVPFRVDFAKSCNTAFASLAPKLGADGLAVAGRSLGLEGSWHLGLDAFAGKVSTGGPPAEQAAAAFGQGTTLVSPLAMAAATAAVASGRWQQPRLVLDPAPGQPAPPGPQLKATSLGPLRAMMRDVVTQGTAEALRDVPGPPVQGKTGTAEYDNDPAHTHAWFVGWQGDIAFAVFVEKGGSSTASAVPIAERFLRAVNAH